MIARRSGKKVVMSRRSSLALALAATALGVTGALAFVQPSTTPVAAGPIAVVDGLALTRELLASPEYLSVRDTEIQQLEAQLKALQDQLNAQQEKMRNLQATDPNAEAEVAIFRQLQQQFEQARNAAGQQFNLLTSRQLSQTFARVAAAADAVGGRIGYAYVISSTSAADIGKDYSFEEMRELVQAGIALRAPAGANITALVRTELGLPDPATLPTTIPGTTTPADPAATPAGTTAPSTTPAPTQPAPTQPTTTPATPPGGN